MPVSTCDTIPERLQSCSYHRPNLKLSGLISTDIILSELSAAWLVAAVWTWSLHSARPNHSTDEMRSVEMRSDDVKLDLWYEQPFRTNIIHKLLYKPLGFAFCHFDGRIPQSELMICRLLLLANIPSYILLHEAFLVCCVSVSLHVWFYSCVTDAHILYACVLACLTVISYTVTFHKCLSMCCFHLH